MRAGVCVCVCVCVCKRPPTQPPPQIMLALMLLPAIEGTLSFTLLFDFKEVCVGYRVCCVCMCERLCVCMFVSVSVRMYVCLCECAYVCFFSLQSAAWTSAHCSFRAHVYLLLGLARTIYIRCVYGNLAGKSPYIRSYTVYINGSGQP